jgi:anti-anti-sigma regulatory factor
MLALSLEAVMFQKVSTADARPVLRVVPACSPYLATESSQTIKMLGPVVVGEFPSNSAQSAESPRLLQLVGELDFSVAPALRLLLETLPPHCEIDLSAVRFLDAGIVTEFVRLAKRVAPERVTLVGVRPHIRRLIVLLKLDRVFACMPEASATGPPLVFKSHID